MSDFAWENLPAGFTVPNGVYNLLKGSRGLTIHGFRNDPKRRDLLLVRVRPVRGYAGELLFNLGEKLFDKLPIARVLRTQVFKHLFNPFQAFFGQFRRRKAIRVNEIVEGLGLDPLQVGMGAPRRVYSLAGQLVGEDGQQYVAGGGMICLEHGVGRQGIAPSAKDVSASSGIKPPNGTTVEKNDGGAE